MCVFAVNGISITFYVKIERKTMILLVCSKPCTLRNLKTETVAVSTVACINFGIAARYIMH